MNNSAEHYYGVLRDLQEQEKQLEMRLQVIKKEKEELARLIEGIQKRMPAASSGAVPRFISPASASSFHPSPTQSFAGMSIRWAILTVLGGNADAMSVSDIVDALKAGGIEAREDKLRNNVSAVLSRMASNEEIVNSGNSYVIAPRGLGALSVIQLSPKNSPKLNIGHAEHEGVTVGKVNEEGV